MPIIFDINDIWIAPNEIFYMTTNAAQMRGKTFLTQNGIKYMGTYALNDNEQKQLRSMLPNFQLKVFQKWMKVKVSTEQYQNELIFYPYNYYGSFGQVGYPVTGFQAVSQATKKYKEWLGTDNIIFMKPYIRKIPKPLTDCEKLFDKDVLEIKQLVKDIGDLNNLIHKEQKNFILDDGSDFIKETFFTKLNKNIPSDGIISLQYDYNKKTLINWKNKLGFKIDKNIKKEFITLQLEEALVPKKIETEDSKMMNISVLLVNEFKKQIADSFLIEGLQKFEQYTTINPINVEILNPYLRNKLLFDSSNYKCNFRFVANSLLFSSAIVEETSTIFITTNKLIDATHMLINGKLFQGIGAIYISEIEIWDKIKNKSHWLNIKLTDSLIPRAAKHFAFGFETQDFNNLLNFEYFLLNDKGELLNFADGETKIPALNFFMQVVY